MLIPSEIWSCSVGWKTVGSNSIHYMQCILWTDKRCNENTRSTKQVDFTCDRCKGAINAKKTWGVDFPKCPKEYLDVVYSFYYTDTLINIERVLLLQYKLAGKSSEN